MRSFIVLVAITLPLLALAATTVPNEIQQPGTQPGEVAAFQSPDNCDNCHSGITQPTNPGLEPERDPGFGWRGGMMANAGRDPLFWGTVAVAEQDFIPNADPSHAGWRRRPLHPLPQRRRLDRRALDADRRQRPQPDGGHATASSASSATCWSTRTRRSTSPGRPRSRTPPFQAVRPAPSSEAYRGSGHVRDQRQRHPAGALQRRKRQARVPRRPPSTASPSCADLPRREQRGRRRPGAQQRDAEPPAGRRGASAASSARPVDGKAAFNNPPHKYGIVERTSSEHVASALRHAAR